MFYSRSYACIFRVGIQVAKMMGYVSLLIVLVSCLVIVPCSSLQKTSSVPSFGVVNYQTGSIYVKWHRELREMNVYSDEGWAISEKPGLYAQQIVKYRPVALITFWDCFGTEPSEPMPPPEDDFWILANGSPEVRNFFHENGVKILAYVPTGWLNVKLGPNNRSNLPLIKERIRRCMELGADGIFVDEVISFEPGEEIAMAQYGEIYDYIKSFGAEKIVVLNAGGHWVFEPIMQASDIVCVENDWRAFRDGASGHAWKIKYPNDRFMAYTIRSTYFTPAFTLEKAISDTEEAVVDYGWFMAARSFNEWSDLHDWYDSGDFDAYMEAVWPS